MKRKESGRNGRRRVRWREEMIDGWGGRRGREERGWEKWKVKGRGGSRELWRCGCPEVRRWNGKRKRKRDGRRDNTLEGEGNE